MYYSIIRKVFDLQDSQMFSFQCGYLAGMTASLVVFLLLVLLYLIFRSPSRLSGITLNLAHGSLFVSATAISDLVRSLEKDFPVLRIKKCVLSRKDKEIILFLKVNLDAGPDSPSMKDTGDLFQKRLIDLLKGTFGIDTITRINMDICRGRITR